MPVAANGSFDGRISARATSGALTYAKVGTYAYRRVLFSTARCKVVVQLVLDINNIPCRSLWVLTGLVECTVAVPNRLRRGSLHVHIVRPATRLGGVRRSKMFRRLPWSLKFATVGAALSYLMLVGHGGARGPDSTCLGG